jgi:hypothetical protein
MVRSKRWDIFCRVIDNHGDIGVCWRLAADLAARGHAARLWVDDARALSWMAPGAHEGRWPGIEVRDWALSTRPEDAGIADAGRRLDRSLRLRRSDWIPGPSAGSPSEKRASHLWINLEYFSAEAYV